MHRYVFMQLLLERLQVLFQVGDTDLRFVAVADLERRFIQVFIKLRVIGLDVRCEGNDLLHQLVDSFHKALVVELFSLFPRCSARHGFFDPAISYNAFFSTLNRTAMIYFSTSKLRDLSNAYNPHTYFPAAAGRVRNRGEQESRELVDPKNYTGGDEELCWDEYGNPYIRYNR